MQKLLELLNQFDDEEGKDLYEWEIEWEDIIWYNRFWGWYETIDVSKSVIISKRYWFIERLSENNKINFHKSVFTSDWSCDRDDIFYEMHYKSNLNIINEQYWVQEPDCIIMYLSVEENPVETLISMLREWD